MKVTGVKTNFKSILKARAKEQKLAQKAAEEARLQNLCRKVAKSTVGPFANLNVYDRNVRTTSIHDLSQEYTTLMSLVNSQWAPWSKSFRK